MSNQYDEYLRKHIDAVKKCYMLLTGRSLENEHDYSKFYAVEYSAYDRFFYSDVEPDEKAKTEFQYALLHHIHNNTHHWQHWVSINTSCEIKPLEIPLGCIQEMIADWASFHFKKDGGSELIAWYEDHKDLQIIHDNSRKIIDAYIVIMARLIDEHFLD